AGSAEFFEADLIIFDFPGRACRAEIPLLPHDFLRGTAFGTRPPDRELLRALNFGFDKPKMNPFYGHGLIENDSNLTELGVRLVITRMKWSRGSEGVATEPPASPNCTGTTTSGRGDRGPRRDVPVPQAQDRAWFGSERGVILVGLEAGGFLRP